MNQERFKQITTFVLDVDGVLTDGTLGALASGEQFRTFYVRDGYGMERAIKAGYRFCIITGGNQEGVRKRMEYLKIDDLYMGSGGESKLKTYERFLEESRIPEEQILYMGDDIPDYEVMQRSALLATCPADAIADIKAIAQYVSPYKGGRGAVRDVIEQVLRSQSRWITA